MAVGGVPRPLSIPGAEHSITSDGFFDLNHQPQNCLVIGAGFVVVVAVSSLMCKPMRTAFDRLILATRSKKEPSIATLACRFGFQGVRRTTQFEILQQQRRRRRRRNATIAVTNPSRRRWAIHSQWMIVPDVVVSTRRVIDLSWLRRELSGICALLACLLPAFLPSFLPCCLCIRTVRRTWRHALLFVSLFNKDTSRWRWRGFCTRWAAKPA